VKILLILPPDLHCCVNAKILLTWLTYKFLINSPFEDDVAPEFANFPETFKLEFEKILQYKSTHCFPKNISIK
jgi:hypothetical protein